MQSHSHSYHCTDNPEGWPLSETMRNIISDKDRASTSQSRLNRNTMSTNHSGNGFIISFIAHEMI